MTSRHSHYASGFTKPAEHAAAPSRSLRSRRLLAGVLLSALGSVSLAAHAEGMHLTSSAFEDNGLLPATYAGLAECGGTNTSPPLAWQNMPAGTRSIVITIKDPDGNKGGGVVHWLAYNIPPHVTSFAAGAGNKTTADVTVGKNIAGVEAYRGMCPPVGDTAHHYIISLTATDLEPGRLPPGLDANGLTAALAGHTINGTTLVVRYAR